MKECWLYTMQERCDGVQQYKRGSGSRLDTSCPDGCIQIQTKDLSILRDKKNIFKQYLFKNKKHSNRIKDSLENRLFSVSMCHTLFWMWHTEKALNNKAPRDELRCYGDFKTMSAAHILQQLLLKYPQRAFLAVCDLWSALPTRNPSKFTFPRIQPEPLFLHGNPNILI